MPRLRLPEALPPLKGWNEKFYLSYWLLLCLAAVVGPVGTAITLSHAPYDALRTLGVDWWGADRGVKAALVFGDEARAKGVATGDRIVAVNGVPLGDAPLLQTGAEGAIARLTVRRADGRERIVALTFTRANLDRLFAGTGLTPARDRWLTSVPMLLTAAFQLFAAILLFLRRRDPVAALLSLGLLALTATNGQAHIFWEALGWYPVVLVVLLPARPALLLGLLLFPNGRFEPRWTWAAVPLMIFGPLLGLLPAGSLPVLVDSASVLIVCLLIVAALVVRYVRDRRIDGARQWRWAILGLVCGFGFSVLFFTVLQPLIGELATRSRLVTAWEPTIIGCLFAVNMILLFGGVVLSVLRYRLYDTQAAVGRSVLYGVLTIALLAIFAGSEKIVEVLGEEYFGESLGAMAGGLAAAFAAVAVGPLHHRVSHWVQHRFRRNLIHLGHDLPPQLIELGGTADPRTLAHTALEALAHALHATRGAVVERGDVLARHGVTDVLETIGDAGPVGEVVLRRAEPAFPVRVRLGGDGRSWLLLGPRPDGSLYDAQERDVLGELARPLAHALHVAAARTAREAQTAERFDRLERELAGLRSALRANGASAAG